MSKIIVTKESERLVNNAAEGSTPLPMEVTMTGIGRTVKSAVGESLHGAMVIAMTESGTMVISAVEGSIYGQAAVVTMGS